MKLYYMASKRDPKDITFWEKDIKTTSRPLSCLAFFYGKESAQKYLEYLKEDDEVAYKIYSVKI